MLAHQRHPKLFRLLPALVAVVLAVGLLAVLGVGLSQVNASSAAVGVWEPMSGPLEPGGKVNALVVQRAFSGTVYSPQNTFYTIVGVANDGAAPKVYRSDDGTASWQTVFTSTDSLDTLDVAGNVVYLAGNRSIYRSLNQGLTWTEVFTGAQDGLEQHILALVINPVQTSTVYASGWEYNGTENWSIVLRTNDGGATWTRVLTTPVPAPNSGTSFNVLAINPMTPTTVYVGGAETVEDSYDINTVIYRTPDGGATWNRVFSTTISELEPVWTLVVDPFTPTQVLAGTSQWGSSNKILRSTDDGLNWTRVFTGAGSGIAFVAPDTAYALAERGGLYASIDGGANWTDTGYGSPDWWRSPSPLVSGQTALYLGGQAQGVWKSTDDGANWMQQNAGIVSPPTIVNISIDPDDSTKILVGGDPGSWLTTNRGQAWTHPSGWSNWMMQTHFAFNSVNPNIVFAGGCCESGILRSSTGGSSFDIVQTSPSPSGMETIYAVAVAPSLSTTVYAVGIDDDRSPDIGEHGIVLRSFNDGLSGSWTEVFTRSNASFVAVSIDPVNAAMAYMGGEECSDLGCWGVLYRTANAGLSWTEVLTDNRMIHSLVVDYQKPNVLYAATDGYRVYKSSDHGDTWSIVRLAPWEPGGESSGKWLAIDPRVPSHVYLAGWGYIAETVDGGVTWSGSDDPINQGTPEIEPSALAVANAGMTQTLYASFAGLWRYERLAPQPGSAMTLTLSSSALTVTAGSTITFTSKVVDQFENWVADGTVVTFTSPGFFITTTAQVNAGYAAARLTALKPGAPIVAANTGAASATVAITVQPHRVFLPIVIR